MNELMVAKLTTFQFHTIVFTVFVLTSQILFSQTRKKDSIKEEAIKAINIYKKNFKEILPAQTLQGEELERLNSHSVAELLRSSDQRLRRNGRFENRQHPKYGQPACRCFL